MSVSRMDLAWCDVWVVAREEGIDFNGAQKMADEMCSHILPCLDQPTTSTVQASQTHLMLVAAAPVTRI